jgi:hypothetical protein
MLVELSKMEQRYDAVLGVLREAKHLGEARSFEPRILQASHIARRGPACGIAGP